jgi:hypothetical protein
MKSFRMYWMDEDDDRSPEAPALRPVSRSAPARPRWGILYVSLGVIGALGFIAHVDVHDPAWITAIDAVFGGLLFAVLIGWVHVNRIALTRMDEPDAGVGRPIVTIIRSNTNGVRHIGQVTRLQPEDRIVLPYDFR